MSDLEAILRHETVEEPAVDETPEVEVVEAEAVKPEPEQPKAKTDDGKVPIQALLEEREKRQQYERELKDFRDQQEKAKSPKLPDYFENPDEYNAAIERMVQERVSGVEQRVNQQMSQAWLSMSERAAKARYTDFDAMLEAFSKEAETNPVLAAQMMQSPDPGEYVYQTGRKLQALSSTPDLDSLREQMREEIRAELLAEARKGEDEKRARLDSIPKSLSREQSAAGPRESEWQPTSLEDALRRR